MDDRHDDPTEELEPGEGDGACEDQFSMLPVSFIASGLDDACVRLYGLIDGQRGRTFRGFREAARKLNWDREKVPTHVEHLVKLGILKVEESANSKTVMRIAHNPARGQCNPAAELPAPKHKKRKDASFAERKAEREGTPGPEFPATSPKREAAPRAGISGHLSPTPGPEFPATPNGEIQPVVAGNSPPGPNSALKKGGSLPAVAGGGARRGDGIRTCVWCGEPIRTARAIRGCCSKDHAAEQVAAWEAARAAGPGCFRCGSVEPCECPFEPAKETAS